MSGPPLLKFLFQERKVLLLVDNVEVTVHTNGQLVGESFVFRRRPDSVGDKKKSGACV